MRWLRRHVEQEHGLLPRMGQANLSYSSQEENRQRLFDNPASTWCHLWMVSRCWSSTFHVLAVFHIMVACCLRTQRWPGSFIAACIWPQPLRSGIVSCHRVVQAHHFASKLSYISRRPFHSTFVICIAKQSLQLRLRDHSSGGIRYPYATSTCHSPFCFISRSDGACVKDIYKEIYSDFDSAPSNYSLPLHGFCGACSWLLR